jgi:hypothetical protein
MRYYFTLKHKILLLVVFAIALSAIFVSSYYTSRKKAASLLAHKGFTSGNIIRFQKTTIPVMRAYEYRVKGTKKSSLGISMDTVQWVHFIWKSFPVIYDTTNPVEHFMLIFPDDFKKYGLLFPDSLKWVLQYNRKYAAKKPRDTNTPVTASQKYFFCP